MTAGGRRRPSKRMVAVVAVVTIFALSAVGRSPDPDDTASVQPTTASATSAVTPASATPSAVPSATASPSPAPSPTLTSAPVLGSAPIGPTERATVVRVVDGDTIVVDRGRGEERLRYIGVDTPETVAPGEPVEWMGPEASAANKALVRGRTVTLEKDVSETDRFGRLLRYVWLEDGSDAGASPGWLLVNLELVRRGFAQVSTFPPDVRYVELYLAAQRMAREQDLGLWGDPPDPTPDPTPKPPQSTPKPDGNCDPSYPTVCIPPYPPDLDCGEISFRNFKVKPPDPHGFDGDNDGIGCET